VSNKGFGLFLFSTNLSLIQEAIESGLTGVVVDWEFYGKDKRQAGADTQINRNSPQDLQKIHEHTSAHILCRINQVGAETRTEIEQAITHGADEIILPMVRHPDEVKTALEITSNRIGVGIMLETVAATEKMDELASFPISRVYVGLNDLAIERRTDNIFTAVSDGLVEKIREHFHLVPFGFAGLTLPDAGYPIPCRLLIAEMARLDCDFSFLRRSFHRDIAGKDVQKELPRISAALDIAKERTPAQVQLDRLELNEAIKTWHNPF
jgi:2-keto-3-deoxy-L-rhamnonate aldolase RhmA